MNKQRRNARKNRSDGDVTRTKILNVGRALCLEFGYDAVTSKDICDAAHTNIAAVNYHFTNRNGLFKEIEKLGHIPSYRELLAENQALKEASKCPLKPLLKSLP